MQIQLTIQYTIKQPSLNYFKAQRRDLKIKSNFKKATKKELLDS